MTKSGIYKITNIINGKIYVGSAFDIGKRWYQHKLSTSNPNSPISKAIKKYGEGSFLFEILEEVSNQFIIEREQYYLDSLQPFGKNGYNLCKIAGNSSGRECKEETRNKISEANTGRHVGRKSVKAKPTVFLSPEGDLIEFESINLGCKERGLHVACMAEVARGARRQYRGWICPSAPKWKPKPRCYHKVVSPLGQTHEITNMKDFCKDNNLDYRCMMNVVSDSNNQKQYKGWRKFGTSIRVYNIIDPDGEAYIAFDLKEFCTEHGLNYNSMRNVSCNQANHHRGWVVSKQVNK